MQIAQAVFAGTQNGTLDDSSSSSEDASILLLHRLLVVFPTCAASLSLCIYAVQQLRRIYTSTQKGGIRLPEDGVNSRRSGRIRLEDHSDREEDKVLDVWDIQDEEMEIDGYPIEEEAFWRKVCPLSIVVNLDSTDCNRCNGRPNSRRPPSFCSFLFPLLRIYSRLDSTSRYEANSTSPRVQQEKRSRRSHSLRLSMSTRFSYACHTCHKRQSRNIGARQSISRQYSSLPGSVNSSM